tara:strand:- start:5105 stop:5509 length:405 start_codon:yes stop_codon:yes gene_type:complete
MIQIKNSIKYIFLIMIFTNLMLLLPFSNAQSCGDGTCDADEDSYSCPSDCGEPSYYCGDNICEGDETSSSCPEDCGTSDTETCGNGFCGSGESSTSCPSDCSVCGEGPISSSGCECGGVVDYGGYYLVNVVFKY